MKLYSYAMKHAIETIELSSELISFVFFGIACQETLSEAILDKESFMGATCGL